MTRTELMRKAMRLMVNCTWYTKQLNKCKCWLIYAPDNSMVIIKSYCTPVAIYNAISHTMYVFDFYSITTQAHIRKAVNELNAVEIIYLYQRSDNCIRYMTHSGCKLNRLTPKERIYINKYDWLMYIENGWHY